MFTWHLKRPPRSARLHLAWGFTGKGRVRRARDEQPTGIDAVPQMLSPTNEEIDNRAYEIFRERNGRAGSAQEDWLQAEREIQKRKRDAHAAAVARLTALLILARTG